MTIEPGRLATFENKMAAAARMGSKVPPAKRLANAEARIERGVAAIGQALTEIKEDKLYRAAGYKTFEEYCQQRWGISRSYAHRQIEAAQVIDLLPMGNKISERQARELVPLKDRPEEAEAAYEAAVKSTNGKPTAKAIKAEVEKVTTPKPEPEPKPRILVKDWNKLRTEGNTTLKALRIWRGHAERVGLANLVTDLDQHVADLEAVLDQVKDRSYS